MKKKLFLMTMFVCMGLAMTACTEKTDTEQSEDIVAETESNVSEVKKEKSNTDGTRIVSVNDVEDYVTIAQYKGIELESISTEVTEEMIDERIAEILADASTESLGSKAEIQNGDVVTISYVGTIDGKSFDGGTVTYYDWIVGSGDMLPEFEAEVLGMKKGETKEILCTFPEDYHGTELAGKEVSFTVNIQSVRRAPELDDDWVASNSKVTTVEEYREAVRTKLEAEMEITVENELKSTAWENIVTNSAMIEYPEKDLETAKTLYNAQMTVYAETYEMTLEEFVISQGFTMEEYEEQCQLYAERKVKQNLIVQGILDAEGIRLDDEECLEIENQIMETYGAESLAELIDMYSQVQIDESIALLRVENFIYENAVIVEPVAAVQESEGIIEEEIGENNSEETSDDHSEGTEASVQENSQNVSESTEKEAKDNSEGADTASENDSKSTEKVSEDASEKSTEE